MKFLFKAYACEIMQGHSNRSLLPGVGAQCPLEAAERPVKKGDRLHVEFADGSCTDTDVLGVTQRFLDKKTMPFPMESALLFYTPEVSPDFHPKGLELGAKVFLLDENAKKA